MGSDIQQLIDMGMHLPINIPNYFGINGTIRFPRQLDKISLKYDNVLNEFATTLQGLIKPVEYFMTVPSAQNFKTAWLALQSANNGCHELEADSEAFIALFEGFRYCLDALDFTLNQMTEQQKSALPAKELSQAEQAISDFFAQNDRPSDDRLQATELYPEK